MQQEATVAPLYDKRDIKALKIYLSRYGDAARRRSQTEKRLATLRTEMKKSAKDGATTPSGGASAALAIRADECLDKLAGQQREAERSIIQVLNILDFLDPDSSERMVLELRYIDKMSWSEVADQLLIGRTACFSKHNKGICKLLEYKKVREDVRTFGRQRGLYD